jgi:hypothetical protein
MSATLGQPLAVATCIACGARSRAGECAEGCSDVPLDLVDVSDLELLAARLEALQARIAALRAVVVAIAGAVAPASWTAVRERARAALRLPVPDPEAPKIVEAWGCPNCGRIDAPQPCLGVCVRHPVLMADARECHELLARVEEAMKTDRALSTIVRLAAHVRPQPGREDRTWTALRSRADDLLKESPPCRP